MGAKARDGVQFDADASYVVTERAGSHSAWSCGTCVLDRRVHARRGHVRRRPLVRQRQRVGWRRNAYGQRDYVQR